MSTTTFSLPRLYHRPGSTDGPASGSGEMLAASPGLTRVHWDESRRLAPLFPPPPDDHPQGAIGLYRGQTVDFILAHARLDADGQPIVQYVMLTSDLLRKVAGRVDMLAHLTGSEPPRVGADALPAAQLPAPAAPTVEEQVDDLLTFMLSVQDNAQVIEGLLSGLIQAVPLAIIGGPRDLDRQLAFVKGLLTLLPPPARFGVTFATFVRRLEITPVQIAFLANDVLPDGALGYDWDANKLLGDPPEDPYSRYIMQQLRLDVTLAVRQMVDLTRTAAWRLTRHEPLAQALGWAARRVALDAAVTEGQPADSGMVAAVLREDPTLSDELRSRYARHLLAFTLALEDPEPAEIIAVQVRQHASISGDILAMLDDAITEGKGRLVYTLVSRWLANPAGPEGSSWQQRAAAAASSHLQDLVAARNVPAAIAFLEDVQRAGDTLMLSRSASDLLEVALPLASGSTELTRQLFLLAAEYLPPAQFQRLARMNNILAELPGTFRDALGHFQPGQSTTAPVGLLAAVAAEFGEEYELVVLARLVEWVIGLERPDLVDTPTLRQLVRLAQSPLKSRFAKLLALVVQDVGRGSMLLLLDAPGPRLLVELLLLLGEYRDVVALLERISKTIFRGDAQADYGPWVSELFEYTGLGIKDLLTAMGTLEQLEMKPVPLAMACRGALINKSFDPELEPLITRLTNAIAGDPLLVPVVGYPEALQLLQFHARRQNVDEAVSLAAVITNSLGGAEEGLGIVARIWTLLNWNKDVREAALELLRRYVRHVPHERAVTIPARVGKKLGAKVGDMLQATVVVCVMTGDGGFEAFTEDVRIATALLSDTVAVYEDKPVPLKRLRGDLDGLSGGVSEAERQQIGDDLLTLARLAYRLGEQRGRGRGRDRVEQKLLANEQVPMSGLDALLYIGGRFSGGEVIPPDIQREAMAHVLGRRSVVMLMKEAAVTRHLLERLLEAFPPGKTPQLTAPAFEAEIDSLWKGMRLYDQRRLKDEFAANTQGLAAVLGIVAEKGDEKALDDSGLGRSLETAKREPKSALEVLRLLSGYFQRKFTL